MTHDAPRAHRRPRTASRRPRSAVQPRPHPIRPGGRPAPQRRLEGCRVPASYWHGVRQTDGGTRLAARRIRRSEGVRRRCGVEILPEPREPVLDDHLPEEIGLVEWAIP